MKNLHQHKTTPPKPIKTTLEKKTFAKTTLNINSPKKDQVIIFEYINKVPQIEYIIAISKIIPPKNIKYVSRISNNRFSVCFNDKNTVDLLINNHPVIKLNDHALIKIRRLVNPAKRIIISNLSPAISNDNITAQLQNHKIQLLSPITHINAGFNIKELAHILSFRRQFHINHEDFHKLPNSLLITAENTPHRIFFSITTPSQAINATSPDTPQNSVKILHQILLTPCYIMNHQTSTTLKHQHRILSAIDKTPRKFEVILIRLKIGHVQIFPQLFNVQERASNMRNMLRPNYH